MFERREGKVERQGREDMQLQTGILYMHSVMCLLFWDFDVIIRPKGLHAENLQQATDVSYVLRKASLLSISVSSLDVWLLIFNISFLLCPNPHILHMKTLSYINLTNKSTRQELAHMDSTEAAWVRAVFIKHNKEIGI